jgi:hypothetical protein
LHTTADALHHLYRIILLQFLSFAGYVQPITERDVLRRLLQAVDTMCRKGTSQATLVTDFAAYVKLLPNSLKLKYTQGQFSVLLRLLTTGLGVPLASTITSDVCPNDCILYRQAYRDLDVCPNLGCGASRYAANGTAARQFTHMYMLPRVRRMFGSLNWSKLLEYSVSRQAEAGWISDVLDGSAYRRVFGPNPGQIPISKYNLAMSFGADGLPISKRDKTYSTTPLLFHMCSICPALRALWDHLFCTGFTPGPGKNNVAIFLQQVAEELQRAWKKGFPCWDAMTGLWHTVRIVLLFGIFDLRGTAAVTDGNQSPAIVHCHLCDVTGEYLKPYKATYYNGDWTHLPPSLLRNGCERRKFPGIADPPPRIRMRTEAAAIAACDLAEASRSLSLSSSSSSSSLFFCFYTAVERSSGALVQTALPNGCVHTSVTS